MRRESKRLTGKSKTMARLRIVLKSRGGDKYYWIQQRWFGFLWLDYASWAYKATLADAQALRDRLEETEKPDRVLKIFE